jgi:hypothetical protein
MVIQKHVTIEKDGTFKSVQTSETYTYGSVATIYTSTTEGVWSFEGAIKDQDIKSKECVTFHAEKITSVSPSGTTTTSYTGTNILGGYTM